ncbi:MAG: 50S ribosomal protein L3 [Clostridiales bacterium]|jgi:large subunit ribosomal protein L3|nr:50S ribosomal protein L3 [Clostridiales bacterium]
MKKAILAKKVGMTQIFSDDGKLVGVTALTAGPCVVVQKKTVEKEGYNAVKVGFEDIKIKRTTKPVKGQFDKAGVTPLKFLREFRLEDITTYETGDTITADAFKAGERVDVSGVSKGKGYQGAIKRHNQSRGPMAHGSKYHRGLGSLSSGTTPGRVKKGKKMPGHMGARKVTAQNLEIIRVDAEKNLILIKGAVPGPNGALIFIRDTVKV